MNEKKIDNGKEIEIINRLLKRHPKLKIASLARRIGWGRTVLSGVYNESRQATPELRAALEEAEKIPSLEELEHERSRERSYSRASERAPLNIGKDPPSPIRPYAAFTTPVLFGKMKQLAKDLPRAEPFTSISILTAIKEVAEELKMRVFRG